MGIQNTHGNVVTAILESMSIDVVTDILPERQHSIVSKEPLVDASVPPEDTHGLLDFATSISILQVESQVYATGCRGAVVFAGGMRARWRRELACVGVDDLARKSFLLIIIIVVFVFVPAFGSLIPGKATEHFAQVR